MQDHRLDLIKFRLAKSNDEIEISKECIKLNKYAKSLTCSYAALYYALRALAAVDEQNIMDHEKLIQYASDTYMDTDIIDENVTDIIIEAEKESRDAEYKDFYFVSKDKAVDLFETARIFLEDMTEFILNKLDKEKEAEE